jgi:hypothetical protein
VIAWNDKATHRATDAVWLADFLKDGREHELSDIIACSQNERGHGLTVHSRISDLRIKHGYDIVQRSARRNGRAVSFYRMVGKMEDAA